MGRFKNFLVKNEGKEPIENLEVGDIQRITPDEIRNLNSEQLKVVIRQIENWMDDYYDQGRNIKKLPRGQNTIDYRMVTRMMGMEKNLALAKKLLYGTSTGKANPAKKEK